MRYSLKIACLAATFSLAAGQVMSQNFNSAYFTQDYKYRHDLNAAFGNDQNYVALPVLGNLDVKMLGNFGVGDVLFQNPATGRYDRTFMHPDVSVSEALSGLNDGQNRIQAELGLTLVSAGFKAFGGYNTIELRERTTLGLMLPYELFEFAKDLRNRSYEFDNIGLRATSFAELAFGHSRQLGDQLRVGAKFKVLLGVARADMMIDGMTANFVGNEWLVSSGKAQAQVSIKGIKFVDTTDDYKGSRGGSYEHVDLGETDVDGAGLNGLGLGLDLGAEYEVMEGLRLSAALHDLGFIGWNNSVLLEQRKGSFTFDGFHDIKIKDNQGIEIGDQVDDYKDQLSDFVNFQNRGDQGSKTTALAATMSVGAEYRLADYEPLSFGLLGQHRFEGDYSWTEGRLSVNWAPLKWLDGGVSFALNSFTTSMGWVLNVHPAGVNFFIGMDHILGKQTKEFLPLSSNAHIALGINVAWGGGSKEKRTSGRQIRSVNNDPTYDSPVEEW